MKNNLEVLVEAYVRLTLEWNKASVGENAQRIWHSCDQLMRLIRKEVTK